MPSRPDESSSPSDGRSSPETPVSEAGEGVGDSSSLLASGNVLDSSGYPGEASQYPHASGPEGEGGEGPDDSLVREDPLEGDDRAREASVPVTEAGMLGGEEEEDEHGGFGMGVEGERSESVSSFVSFSYQRQRFFAEDLEASGVDGPEEGGVATSTSMVGSIEMGEETREMSGMLAQAAVHGGAEEDGEEEEAHAGGQLEGYGHHGSQDGEEDHARPGGRDWQGDYDSGFDGGSWQDGHDSRGDNDGDASVVSGVTLGEADGVHVRYSAPDGEEWDGEHRGLSKEHGDGEHGEHPHDTGLDDEQLDAAARTRQGTWEDDGVYRKAVQLRLIMPGADEEGGGGDVGMDEGGVRRLSRGGEGGADEGEEQGDAEEGGGAEGSGRPSISQLRSARTRERVSDMQVRITRFERSITEALVQDAMSLEAHKRVRQRFQVVSEVLANVSRALRQGAAMPLVYRDQHDLALRESVVEVMSVAYEAGMEAADMLEDLRANTIEVKGWLDNLEEEVERIRHGTVILAVSDDGELQPLFQRLYEIWTTTNSPLGRAFVKWRQAVHISIMAKDKAAMERVVSKLKSVMNAGMSTAWKGWTKVVLNKRKKNNFVAKKFLVNLQSYAASTFGSWRFMWTKSKKIKRMQRVMTIRFSKIAMETWHVWASFNRGRTHRKLMATTKQRWKEILATFNAWRLRAQKLKVLVTRHKMHQHKINFRTRRKVMTGWFTRTQRVIYCRKALEKSKKIQYRRPLMAWHIEAHDFVLRVGRSRSILARIKARVVDQCFETWIGYTEKYMIRKFRILKVQYVLSYRNLGRIYKNWYKYALGKFAKESQGKTYVVMAGGGAGAGRGMDHAEGEGISERGQAAVEVVAGYNVSAYDEELKMRRCWRKWLRMTVLARTQVKIKQNWDRISVIIAIRNAWGSWCVYHDSCMAAVGILQRVARSGQLPTAQPDEVFQAWYKVEMTSRLVRFRGKLIASKHSLRLVTRSWEAMRRLTIGVTMAKHEEVLLRVMKARLNRRQVQTAKANFGQWGEWCQRRMMRRVRTGQVEARRVNKTVERAVCEWRKRVWRRKGIWKVAAYGRKRLARHWLRLFRETVVEGRKRMKYGTFCPDCRKPYSMEMPKWKPPEKEASPPKKAPQPPAPVHAKPQQHPQPPPKRLKVQAAPTEKSERRHGAPSSFKVWHDRWLGRELLGVQDDTRDKITGRMSEGEWMAGVRIMQNEARAAVALAQAELQQSSLPSVPSRARPSSASVALHGAGLNLAVAGVYHESGTRTADGAEASFASLLSRPAPQPRPVPPQVERKVGAMFRENPLARRRPVSGARQPSSPPPGVWQRHGQAVAAPAVAAASDDDVINCLLDAVGDRGAGDGGIGERLRRVLSLSAVASTREWMDR